MFTAFHDSESPFPESKLRLNLHHDKQQGTQGTSAQYCTLFGRNEGHSHVLDVDNKLPEAVLDCWIDDICVQRNLGLNIFLQVGNYM